jgi:hypothetical protein
MEMSLNGLSINKSRDRGHVSPVHGCLVIPWIMTTLFLSPTTEVIMRIRKIAIPTMNDIIEYSIT